MRSMLTAAVLAGALALAGCQTGDYAAAPQTRLSQCVRDALIGAGGDAVCGRLSAREHQRVERAYYEALDADAAVTRTWRSASGETRALAIARPSPSDAGPDCRDVEASLSDGAAVLALPSETFCRDAGGAWAPAQAN